MGRAAHRILVTGLVALSVIAPASAVGPAHVDMTWMSITNMYYEIGPLKIVTDGYISRIPEQEFYGGGGGMATLGAHA